MVRLRSVGLDGVVRDDDRVGGQGREQQPGERDGGQAPEHLHDDERGHARGRMPANVLVRVRAMVTAGLAKLVEEVNQYAAAM